MSIDIDPDGAGDALVGSTIDVYWPLDQWWYTASVLEYTDGKHVIKYSDDDHVERLILSNETWRQSTSRPARRTQWFDPRKLRSSDEAVAVWNAACAASEKQMHWEGYGWFIIWKERRASGISTSGKQGDIYCYPPEHQPGKKSHQLRSLSAVLDWLSMRCDVSGGGENNNKMWMPPERMQLIEVLVDADKAAAVEEGGDGRATSGAYVDSTV